MDFRKGELSYQQITIEGIVQGVGFRPFVYKTAKENNLCGYVKNVSGQVEILISGAEINIDKFLDSIINHNIPYAVIKNIRRLKVEPFHGDDFLVVQSGGESQHGENRFFTPDLAVCEVCEKEIFDANNKRYDHPFNTCTNCGPRFSILSNFPYDRENTTMSGFIMCDSCKEEFESSENRRFQAQTNCCNQCGPVLLYKNKTALYQGHNAFLEAVRDLERGKIIGIKGVGGYHFACSPYDSEATALLRTLKQRDSKPFAVMFRDINEIEKICDIHPKEKELLLSNARPITLLKLKQSAFAKDVLAKNAKCGCFLPYTPLQKILLARLPCLVMTSANISGSPIIKDDKAMLDAFNSHDRGIAGVLYNERKIIRGIEDSVAQVVCRRHIQIIRRARGYVPLPIPINNPENISLLAMGGDLKATFSLAAGQFLTMSQFAGDLEDATVYENFSDNIEDFLNLFLLRPQLVVCDCHPAYLSRRLAKKIAGELGIELISVYHHHGHIASVMAEHRLEDRVLGVAFDGSGYGDDGHVWGGEFLICEGGDFNRVGHLIYTKILGADEAARDAEKTAACFLSSHKISSAHPEISTIKAALSQNINTHLSSSMGRLFDAVSSLLGICHINDYEGKCASMLQQYAEHALLNGIEAEKMEFRIDWESGVGIFSHRDILKRAAKCENPYAFALGFHYAVVHMITDMCLCIRRKEKINQIALSGGVFQNRLLLEESVRCLSENGFKIYFNELVPPNDGGLSLGQAYIAIRRGR